MQVRGSGPAPAGQSENERFGLDEGAGWGRPRGPFGELPPDRRDYPIRQRGRDGIERGGGDGQRGGGPTRGARQVAQGAMLRWTERYGRDDGCGVGGDMQAPVATGAVIVEARVTIDRGQNDDP